MKNKKKMNCITIDGFGGPEKLIFTSTDLPRINSSEILIKVKAAGVNRPDLLQREGKYNPPKDANPLPGLEVAGEVLKVGSKVNIFKAHDKVCALTHGGGYAEFCKVHFKHALAIPKKLSFVEAAGIPETFFTVWTNLIDYAKAKKNETLLIHGGSSGIGTAAIQIAKNIGCKIIVTVGNEKKKKVCKKLGANLVINYKKNNFYKEVMKFTKNKGVDIVLDMIGKDYFEDNLKMLRDRGRLVIIAFLSGNLARLDLTEIIKKRLIVTGSTLRPRSILEKAEIAKNMQKFCWPLLKKGIIKPIIFRTFSLSEASKAHKLMESSQHIGKIILEINKNNKE